MNIITNTCIKTYKQLACSKAVKILSKSSIDSHQENDSVNKTAYSSLETVRMIVEQLMDTLLK